MAGQSLLADSTEQSLPPTHEAVFVKPSSGKPLRFLWSIGLVVLLTGCGATRLTDTSRSASEELLLSHAIDRAVGQLNLTVLAGQDVYLDTTNLGDVTYSGYLTGALRQHLLASGARLVPELEQAAVVVEARAGSVATTRHDSMIGIPETQVPAVLVGGSGTLPEIALIKKAIHIGVAKVGVFAYRTVDGVGVWQSGMRETQSISESNWYFGTGPFQTGDVVINGTPDVRRGLRPTRRSHRRNSPLEYENWFGEMPVDQPRDRAAASDSSAGISDTEDADSAGQADGSAPDGDETLPEPIEPGTPEAAPGEEPLWHWVTPAAFRQD